MSTSWWACPSCRSRPGGVGTIVSIDGHAARPNGRIDWFLELRDVVEDVSWPELMPQVEAGLFGAQTYREFAEYWPAQSPAYDVNRIEKHVVSKSLPSAPWGTSASLRIHRDGVVQALEEVQASTSGAVIVWGSLGVSRELFANDLVDEFWLRVGAAPKRRRLSEQDGSSGPGISRCFRA